MSEKTKAEQSDKLDAQQITQLMAAVIDQKVGDRLQQIEEKQAKTDATMEQLPGIVQQFQAMLPQMIQQTVQQNLAAVMQQIAPTQQAAAAPAPQESQQPAPPTEGGAGKIPLGMEIPGQATEPAAQPQNPVAATQQAKKASEIVKQMGGGALAGLAGGGGNPLAALMGGGGGGGMQQILMQMLLKKLLGKEEKPPDPMQTLMGMANMVNQFADAMGMIVGSVDRIRGGFLEQRLQEAQISQIEAKSEAEVLRALNSKKSGGKKA